MQAETGIGEVGGVPDGEQLDQQGRKVDRDFAA